MAWPAAQLRAGAGALHGRATIGPDRSVVFCEVTGPALVLGSTQPASHVDNAEATAAGVEVVRRRSGGGAVLVAPGALVWADVFVPAGDPRWEPDVGRAFWWLGETWAAALASLGVEELTVHRGALVRSPWSAMVCFAGLGPGEVRTGGRKVVGMSQRRTREGALFQCAVPLVWDAPSLVALLSLDDATRGAAAVELGRSVLALAGVGAADVTEAFLAHLP